MTGPAIHGVGRALPPYYADQAQLIETFRELWGARHFNTTRLEELHKAVQVTGRHLALPMEGYRKLTSFGQRNDAWIRAGVELGEAAAREALEHAGLSPSDVDHIFFVTVTGIAVPSVDARLVNRMGMHSAVKRTPIFGLGCLAGAAGLARASDYLRAFPDQVSLLVAVELCSLTLQREDLSIPNIIASGLFGDGAAAVVLGGVERPPAGGPRLIATRSVFYPSTERIMGWDVVDGGFKVVLSAKVPEIVREHSGRDVDSFLNSEGLDRDRVAHWIVHTGGPKVLQAFESSLELPSEALARSWRSLREVGNLSSASVLFVLGDLLAEGCAQRGDYGLLMAMGPGFCSELVLLQW
ncbi:MAG: type III polyketide synthase [Myxococcaceae bacterium]